MDDTALEITALPGVAAIDAAEWDACACPEAADGGRPNDPFTTHRFLSALEASGSVGAGTGWSPRPLLLRAGGQTVAVLPLYVKSHSQGEYIFDHAWADALERSGRRYYPKLQVAVPFTPVTGRRVLARPGWEARARNLLLNAGAGLAADNHLSSLHVTFCTPDEAEAGEAMGFLRRLTQQFHWENRGYADFDGFLADLSSRKRKTIRRERERANAFGGTIRALTGAEITPAHIEAMWGFYQDTGGRKWGSPYLTRRFFDIAHDTMADDMLLILAERDGRPVAGALNFIGRDTLYGRYWGMVEHHDCLHFECCYYRAIDWAIERGLSRIEAGAQGEHKLARGYLPSQTHSLHWIAEPAFARAVADYLEAERAAVGDEIEVLTGYGPFRRDTAPQTERD